MRSMLMPRRSHHTESFERLNSPLGKRNAVVGADGLRQAAFLEKPLKGPESRVFFVRFQSFAKQQKTGSVVGDREGIAVAFVAEQELALIISAPQIIGVQALGQRRSLCPRAAAQPRPTHQSMPIEHSMDSATGRDFDGVRQSPQQALADLASSPAWFLAPGCDDRRLYLLGQLIGVSKRSPRPVT